ncbi:MAG: hypothetical protein LBR49_08500 [Tannerella sp.]|jgi:hypothetical protein|nr:hypothetical protein [Tannerella sp.]
MNRKLNVVVFFMLIFSGFASYFLIPAKNISLEEKRKLAVFPQMQWQNYIQGLLTDSIEDYMDDHFPLRERFIELADEINYDKGIHFNPDEKIVQGAAQSALDHESPAQDSTAFDAHTQSNHSPEHDGTKQKKSKLSDGTMQDSVVYDNIKGYFQNDMLILNGAVFPIGGGVPSETRHFAEMVNEYAEKLKGQVRVITAIAPLSSAFIPSSKYRYLNDRNQQTLEALHNYLSPDVSFSDVLAHLNAHGAEYLYFKTDHHWTALGAYYSYEAFCEATGITPVLKENMEKRTKYHFLGSLYSLTRDKSVKNNPDSIEYYVPQVETTAEYYGQTGFKGNSTSVFCHKCGGYAVFLHVDYPLMKISTNVKNGRKIVVIKDSMGNAFSVYLISHYEEIWVVDFRYSKHNLIDLIQNNHINDMVFAVSLYNTQTRSVANMMKRLATQKHSNQANADATKKETPALNDSVPTINNDIIHTQDTILYDEKELIID